MKYIFRQQWWTLARTIPVLVVLTGSVVIGVDYLMSISYVSSILPSTDESINANDIHGHVKKLAIFSTVLVVAVAVLLHFILKRIVTEPVTELADTSRIINTGDYSVSSHLQQVNELGEISTALDTLAIKARKGEDIKALNTQLVDIVEHTVNEVYVVESESYRILSANLVARQKHSLDLAALENMYPWNLSPQISADVLTDKLQFLREGVDENLVFDTSFINKQGYKYQVELTLQVLNSAVPPVILMIAKDIQAFTDQFADLQLRNKAIDALDVGVTITDASKPHHPIIYVNKAWCRISGYDEADMLGRPVRELQPLDDQQPAHTMIEQAQQRGEAVQALLKSKKKDGTHFMDELFLSPIHNSAGQLTHYIGINRDVTSLMETQRQLENMQKLESVGLLSGGIAHDFNNILTVIQGNLEFLAQDPSEDESTELLSEAANATKMGARLTRRLLTFASRSQLEPCTLDINSLVLESVEILRSAVGESNTLSTSLAVDLWPVFSDQSQVENAIINLTINARDAISGGGQILIETENIIARNTPPHDSISLPEGEYVLLRVSDNGSGIAPEHEGRVLEPFFTTKKSGKGSGLGLSTIYGFIRQTGGQLKIETKAGSGTSVNVYFPRYVAPAEQKPAEQILPIKATDNAVKKVLIVEDNDSVRKISVNRFHSLGFSVQEATDSATAINKLNKSLEAESPFDLVFTDVVMETDTSGLDIAQWVNEHSPQSALMLTSAYSDKLFQERKGVNFLQKPYSLQQLKDAIRVCFDVSRQV